MWTVHHITSANCGALTTLCYNTWALHRNAAVTHCANSAWHHSSSSVSLSMGAVAACTAHSGSSSSSSPVIAAVASHC
eukprot:5438-Heterococcus_DN1.PRE.1